MKKLFFIAVLALANTVVSCTSDTETLTPSNGVQNIKVKQDASLVQKDGDTLGDGDTGGQGGQIPPKP